MKRIRMIALLCMGLFAVMSAHGQNISVKSKSVIEEFQVPVVVRSAFAKEFGNKEQNGIWTVYFSSETKGDRSVAVPIWYAFSGKASGKRFEARFLPDGQLKSSKGLAKKSEVDDVKKREEESKPSNT
jgi:hypothetical protein